VRPAAREDYDALLGDLHARGLVPERVVHLWGIAAPDQPPVTLENLPVVQGRGFYSLMFLVQALEVRFPTAQVVIDTVTDDLFDVLGGEAVHPARATALGLCRVVPQEYPNTRCRSIDVELGPHATVEQAVEQLLREFAAPLDSMVAYRRGHRWVPTFEPAPRPPAPAELPALRQGGVYLVTGGLGGIGLLLAEHLAEKVGAKLVLVGRSGLPPRSKWDAWLEQHGEEDRTSRRIRKVQAVEQRGGEVMVASADIADLEQMRQVVARARMRFGPIHGVIHAAGLNPGGFLGNRRPEDAATVMAPKVEGTLVLQELLRDEQLDFFALCSTTASIFGGIAFADYAGANTFLDALVHSRDMGRAFPFVSINWDLWGEVGMGFDAQPGEEVLKNAITSAEGIDAFRRILADPQPQTIVFPRDFNTQLTISWGDSAAESAGDAAAAVAEEEEEAARPSALGSAHPRPDLPVDYVAPRNQVESSIAEVIQSMLGIDKVGIHDNFFDLGFDSLLAHRAIGRLQQPLGMSLPMRVFLEIPTVAEIATFVEGFRTQNAPAGAPAAAGVGAAAPNADSTR
jgi:acyl carrier protein